MRILVRTTLIATFLSVASVLALTLFVSRIMHMNQPPSDFETWPAPKKEAYLYEHHGSTVKGVDLLQLWLHEPAQALPIVLPETAFTFSLAWVAAFLGGIRRNARP